MSCRITLATETQHEGHEDHEGPRLVLFVSFVFFVWYWCSLSLARRRRRFPRRCVRRRGGRCGRREPRSVDRASPCKSSRLGGGARGGDPSQLHHSSNRGY